MSERTAIVTGANGQDGALLCALLLSKGYKVTGTVRRSSSFGIMDRLMRTGATQHDNFIMEFGDVTDAGFVFKLVSGKPDEVYNLAGQSDVAYSFENPSSTIQINTLGTLNFLEAIRVQSPKTRFYQASTSEMFGNSPPPQSEDTLMAPESPYAVSKLASYQLANQYRRAYGLFAVNGILFNHESQFRGKEFVTTKISLHAALAGLGGGARLMLGNLDAVRDWGHAADYVNGMWLMLQTAKPKDYVLATGKGTTVRQFVEMAYSVVGITLHWQTPTKAINTKTNKVLVTTRDEFKRPLEVHSLIGDPRRAEAELGWKRQFSLEDIVVEMVEHYVRQFGSSRAS